MPALAAEIKGAGHWSHLETHALEHLDLILALLAVVGLAVVADQLTGRRSLDQALLVAGTGAVCGAFMCVRVFAVGSMDGWLWVGWSLVGAVVCLLAHFLLRGKR